MDCTTVGQLTSELVELTRLAVAGAVLAVSMLTMAFVVKTLDRWRRWLGK